MERYQIRSSMKSNELSKQAAAPLRLTGKVRTDAWKLTVSVSKCSGTSSVQQALTHI